MLLLASKIRLSKIETAAATVQVLLVPFILLCTTSCELLSLLQNAQALLVAPLYVKEY